LSLSLPFFTPSEQVAATHLLLVQTELLQSTAPVQALPGAHAGHTPPPQSMSDSPWFLTPSLQFAAAHTPALAQKLLVQSVATAQSFVFAHLGQVPPPQSLSVSAPFLTPSVQDAA
jgi:hypothetical protein